MKTTVWTKLDANDCTVIRIDKRDGKIMSVKIKHNELARALWFVKSMSGNWYWRNTRRESDAYADGYIVGGELFIPTDIPIEYPEYA